MYNFSSHLLANEKILYQGQPVPGKGSKSLGGILFLICFALFIQVALIWSVVTKTGDGANGVNLTFIIIFLTATEFLGFGIYGLLYNLVLKKKQVADDFYCLTNIRAMKYEAKKNKLVFGYLAYYDDIHCNNVKDNFGDVYMGVVADEKSQNDISSLSVIKDLMMNPNPENMPLINFESIEDPYKVMNLVKEAKRDLTPRMEKLDLRIFCKK